MAEFVTKAEHKRRFVTIIVCVVFNVLALGGGIYCMQRASNLDHGEKEPNCIARVNKRLTEEQNKLDLMKANLVEYAQPIGFRRRSGGTTDPLVTGSLNYNKLEIALNDWMEHLNKDFGVPVTEMWKPGTAGGKGTLLKDLFKILDDKEKAYKTQAADLQKDIDGLVAGEKGAVTQGNADSDASKEKMEGKVGPKDDARGNIGELISLQKQFDAEQKANSESLAKAEQERDVALNKLTEQRKDQLRYRAARDAEKAELTRRINYRVYRLEEAKERREPVGTVLAVNENQKLVYIDLLHKDRIFKGSKFKLYSLEKGGLKIDKGEIEIVEVRDAVSSVAAIAKTYDPKNPVKQGDRLYNEFFEKGKTRYIAFAGRFSGKLSSEDAIAMIKRFGDVYQEKVDERTSYLIVADGYEESQNYKLAQEWGVKIMLERYFYEYVGVP